MNAFAASISYRLLGLLFLLTCFHFNGVLAAETRSPAFDIAKVGNSASLQGHLDIFLDSSFFLKCSGFSRIDLMLCIIFLFSYFYR